MKTKFVVIVLIATVALPLRYAFSSGTTNLTINIKPAVAISNGAQWRVSDPNVDQFVWHNSGDTVYQIPVGTTVTVEFAPLVKGPCNITPNKLVITMPAKPPALSKDGIYLGSGSNSSQCK